MVEDQFWDRMPAVGREFGSPDFDRLMEEDYRLGRGVFDPAVRQAFGVGSKPGDRRAGVAEAASGPAAMTASGWSETFAACGPNGRCCHHRTFDRWRLVRPLHARVRALDWGRRPSLS